MIYRSVNDFIPTDNGSACHDYQQELQMDKPNQIIFGVAMGVCALIAVFGMIANGLVLYFATHQPFAGALRHINTVVKHLAVSDSLYGLLSTPFSLVYWYQG